MQRGRAGLSGTRRGPARQSPGPDSAGPSWEWRTGRHLCGPSRAEPPVAGCSGQGQALFIGSLQFLDSSVFRLREILVFSCHTTTGEFHLAIRAAALRTVSGTQDRSPSSPPPLPLPHRTDGGQAGQGEVAEPSTEDRRTTVHSAVCWWECFNYFLREAQGGCTSVHAPS